MADLKFEISKANINAKGRVDTEDVNKASLQWAVYSFQLPTNAQLAEDC